MFSICQVAESPKVSHPEHVVVEGVEALGTDNGDPSWTWISYDSDNGDPCSKTHLLVPCDHVEMFASTSSWLQTGNHYLPMVVTFSVCIALDCVALVGICVYALMQTRHHLLLNGDNITG